MGAAAPPMSPKIYYLFNSVLNTHSTAAVCGALFFFLALGNTLSAPRRGIEYAAPPTPGEEKEGGGHGHH